MKIKRVIQGTALTALAAAAWMGAGSTDASAAAFDTSGITIDYSDNSINVPYTAKELMVSVLKVGKGKSETKITSWDVYDEGGSAKIDLSKLKATTDNYIAIKTDDTDPIVLHIAPSNSTYKAEYHAVEQKINITNPTGNIAFEYRTLYSEWKDTDLNDFGREFQRQGATIYVRERSDLHAPTTPSETKISDVTIKSSPVEMTTYDIGTLPGKELKFNIAKEANGPSVAADYTKGIVKIKTGLEWRFVTAASVGSTSAAAEADAKTGKSVNAIVGTADEGTLEVRKAATGTGKKGKIASKWTRIKVQKLQDVTDRVAGDVADVTTGASTGINVFTSTGASINAKFDYDSKKDKVKSLILTNNLTSDVEYVVKDTEPAVTDKAKKIGKGKTAKLTEKTPGKVWIRIAGNKKDKVWVTNYASVGTLTFPK